MLFISDITDSGQVGVCDTKDFIVEYITDGECRRLSSSIPIAGVESIAQSKKQGYIDLASIIGDSELYKLVNRLDRKLYNDCNRNNLNANCDGIFTLPLFFTSGLPLNNRQYKVDLANYTDTQGFFIATFKGLGYLGVRVSNNFGRFANILIKNPTARLGRHYPICSGDCHKRMARLDYGYENLVLKHDRGLYVKIVSECGTSYYRVVDSGYMCISLELELSISYIID